MMRPLAEQTIVITGATDGLGRALAGELAAAGAALALHGRDDRKGMATIRDLRERTGNEKLQWFRADLAALDQVRDLAGRLQSGLDRVDVLVNNARLATPRRDAGSATCPTSSRGLRPAADAESPGVRGAQERGPDQGTTRAKQRRALALAPRVNRGLP
jgi:NAD(P)-dependent dehydrogenase (short-subunit alcohol dehydrogenase family)